MSRPRETTAVSPRNVARERAVLQHLTIPAETTAARLVAWLGAMQSQDYLLGKWSIALRLANPEADVERAISDGSILRTHVLRPTWHFVARDDLRWMQELTSARVVALMRYADRANGITAALSTRATKTIATAIARRGHLTRPEVAQVLTQAGIARTAWQVGQLLMHAELRGVVCSGVPIGHRQTYALVDERAPRRSSIARDEALATLARRYFQSHGPSMARDFQWWSGLDADDVARAIDMLGSAINYRRCGERTLISVGARQAPPSTRAHLIQPYDEFVVAYRESRDMADVSGAARMGIPGASGALLARGVVYDGQIIARWRLASGRTPRSVVIEPLRRLSPRERDATADATCRFEAFIARSRESAARQGVRVR